MQYESRGSMPGWYSQGRRCFHARRGAGRMDDSINSENGLHFFWFLNLKSFVRELYLFVEFMNIQYTRFSICVFHFVWQFTRVCHLALAKDMAANGLFKVSAEPFESNDHRGYFPPGDFWCQVSKRSLDSEAAGFFSGEFAGWWSAFFGRNWPNFGERTVLFLRCDHSFGLFFKRFTSIDTMFLSTKIPASEKLANKTTFERGQEDHKTVPSSPSHPSPKRHKVRR